MFDLDVILDSAYQGKSNCYEYDFKTKCFSNDGSIAPRNAGLPFPAIGSGAGQYLD